MSLNSHIFLQSTVKSGIYKSVSFNILTRPQIFSEEKAPRILPFVKPRYCENSDIRGDNEPTQGRFLKITTMVEKCLLINLTLAME